MVANTIGYVYMPYYHLKSLNCGLDDAVQIKCIKVISYFVNCALLIQNCFLNLSLRTLYGEVRAARRLDTLKFLDGMWLTCKLDR